MIEKWMRVIKCVIKVISWNFDKFIGYDIKYVFIRGEIQTQTQTHWFSVKLSVKLFIKLTVYITNYICIRIKKDNSICDFLFFYISSRVKVWINVKTWRKKKKTNWKQKLIAYGFTKLISKKLSTPLHEPYHWTLNEKNGLTVQQPFRKNQ